MAKIHTPIPSLKLSDSTSMPMLAYGTGTSWYKTSPTAPIDEALITATKTAISLDYVHLDAAEVYNTEPEVGRAISESKKPRGELYVVTKVIHDGKKSIVGALKESLKKLGLSHVDLYLIHAPFFAGVGDAKPDAALLQDAWKQMEDCKEQGLTTSIGVSNYNTTHLAVTLEAARLPPVCNQIEFHPYLQQPDLLQFHKDHKIATVAYAPLTPVTKAGGGPVDPFLAALAKKYAVNPSEVLLRWCIDQDVVPITTSSKEQRLSDYLRAATFKLTPKEIEQICSLGREKHVRGFWKDKIPGGQ